MPEKYKVVTRTTENLVTPRQLVLDTNFVIDAARAYDTRGDLSNRPHLISALHRFPNTRSTRDHIRPIYGYALHEATVARTGAFDQATYSRLKFAMDEILSWNLEQITRNLENRHPASSRNRQLKKNHGRYPAQEPEPEFARPEPHVIFVYSDLLKVCTLSLGRTKNGSKQSALDLISDFADWQNRTNGVRNSYTMSLAVAMFAGNRESLGKTRRLMKLGGNESGDEIARKCWNAAWDIFMTSLTEGMSLGLLGSDQDGLETGLLTANTDPIFLRSRSVNLFNIHLGTPGTMPYSQVALELAKSDLHEDIKRILQQDPMTDFARFQRHSEAISGSVFNDIQTLESALRVSMHTRTTS